MVEKEKWYQQVLLAFRGAEEDYTSGSLKRAIVLLSIPMIVEMLMESVFALVDIMYASRVSVNAVATIGLTEAVITLIYAVAIGLSMAVSALVSRRVGEKNLKKASETAVQAIILGMGLSAILGVVGFYYAENILYLMGAEEDLIQEGVGYTRWMFGFNITIMLLFLLNAIFRGAGDAHIAMWALVISNGLNIILDPIFIFGFGPIPAYGVEGAGIATNIGRASAVLIQLYILFNAKSKIKIVWREMRLNLQIMGNLIKVSMGGIGQFIIGTSSWMFLMRIMAVFGSDVLAGYTIAIRVMMFSLMPSWGMSNAAATLVGQNLGANQPDRAEKSVWLTAKYNAIFMGAISLIYIFFAHYIIQFFTDSAEVIAAGALCLQVLASGYIFFAYGMVLTQSFNGAGDTMTPTIINLFCFWLLQLPFAYMTAIYFEMGMIGVFIAITGAETLIAIISMILFRRGKWKTFQV